MTAVDLKGSFDRIAEQYQRARPSYPDGIYERMLEFGAIDSSARLLEVGLGTGKATLPLARRGLAILGLEPGPSLAELARAQLAEFANVDVQTVSFEDWRATEGGFDLAFAAQAFHWLAPEQRLIKLAKALKRHGTLAVFGNSAALAAGAVRDAVQRVYQERAPTLRAHDHARAMYGSAQSPIFSELQSSPLFTEQRCEITAWQRELSAPEYCALVATYSDHSTLPEAQLRALLAAVAGASGEHGGSASIAYQTGLFLARAV